MSINSEEISLVRKTEIKRNPDWPELDLKLIAKTVNGYSNYEYKMIMNTCKTNDQAIKAIKNKRSSDRNYLELITQEAKNRRREKYRRRKYKDTEDDIEDEYY